MASEEALRAERDPVLFEVAIGNELRTELDDVPGGLLGPRPHTVPDRLTAARIRSLPDSGGTVLRLNGVFVSGPSIIITHRLPLASSIRFSTFRNRSCGREEVQPSKV